MNRNGTEGKTLPLRLSPELAPLGRILIEYTQPFFRVSGVSRAYGPEMTAQGDRAVVGKVASERSTDLRHSAELAARKQGPCVSFRYGPSSG